MSDWPIDILGVQKQGCSVLFCPSAAKSRGYAVYPLVEIDAGETIDVLFKGFGIPIKYLYLANIDFSFSHSNEYHSFSREEKLPIIHKSIFLRDIETGGYLEALYVNRGVILIVLGGDALWVVLDSSRYPHLPPEFNRLIAYSKENIKILKKCRNFQGFFDD